MLAAEGTVRLADFGCAEELGRYKSDDTCSRTLGSPAFQSPEIATGLESFSGIKVDVWAAGVTLYQMVVGRIPFNAENICDLYEAISRANVDIPEWVGPELKGLIRAILNPVQAERLGLEEIKRHPWMTMELPAEATIALQKRKPRIFELVANSEASQAEAVASAAAADAAAVAAAAGCGSVGAGGEGGGVRPGSGAGGGGVTTASGAPAPADSAGGCGVATVGGALAPADSAPFDIHR